MDLVRVALDFDLFAQCAQFRNQDVGIESIDPDLFAVDIALDNQDRRADFRRLCAERPLEFLGVVTATIEGEKEASSGV